MQQSSKTTNNEDWIDKFVATGDNLPPEKHQAYHKFKLYFQSMSFLEEKSFIPYYRTLINAYEENLQDSKKGITYADVAEILNYIETYYIRRKLIGQSIHDDFKNINNKHNEIIEVQNKYKISYEKAFFVCIDKSKQYEIPKNLVVEEKIINRLNFISPSAIKKLTQFILIRIDMELSNYKQDFNYYRKSLENVDINIEHILPKNKNNANKIGNLTLMNRQRNSFVGNKDFVIKKIYLKRDELAMNKYFKSVSVWDEDSIKVRSNYLIDIVCDIWGEIPTPNINKAKTKKANAKKTTTKKTEIKKLIKEKEKSLSQSVVDVLKNENYLDSDFKYNFESADLKSLYKYFYTKLYEIDSNQFESLMKKQSFLQDKKVGTIKISNSPYGIVYPKDSSQVEKLQSLADALKHYEKNSDIQKTINEYK